MPATTKAGRINIRFLVILVVIVGVLGAGLFVAHRVRKQVIANRALALGKAALQAQDWPEACKQLQVYLGKYPNDYEMLDEYARAQLRVRPITPDNLGKAIGAYRQMLEVKPADDIVCDRLCELYFRVGDFIQVAYTARQRLARDPDDSSAMIWLGRSLTAQRKLDDAATELGRFLERKQNQGVIEIYAILSDAAIESRAANAAQVAFDWLEKAVQRNPSSADALVRRARFFCLVKKDFERTKQDLDKAVGLGSPDPHVQVLIAREWLSLGHQLSDPNLYSKARAAVEQAWKIGASAPTAIGVNADDLLLDIYQTDAEVCLKSGDKQGGNDLARRALDDLKERQRVLFLPYAVDLFQTAGNLEAAHRTVDEYRRAVADAARTDAARAEQLALIEGGLANAEGRYYDALVQLEAVVAASEPRHPRIWRHLSRAYFRTGQDRRGVVALEKYVDRQPKDLPEAAVELVHGYQREGRWPEVLKYARLIEERQPNELQPKLLRLEAVLKGGAGRLTEAQLAQASQELAKLREALPKVADIRLLQAMIAYGQGNSDAAIAELEKAVAECDKTQAASLRLINLLVAAGKTDRAVEACRAEIQRTPDMAAPRVMMAELEWAAGRREEARKVLEEAIAKLPAGEAVKAQYVLVRYQLADGKAAEAIAILRKLATDSPDNVQPRLTLLSIPDIQKDDRESERLVDEIRRIEKDRGLRWRYEQARLLMRRKNWMQQSDAIIDLLKRCVEGDPAWAAPTLTMGGVYELTGRDQQAEQVYRRYVDSYPDQAQVVVALLELLERQRRFAEAKKILDRMPRALVLSGHRTRVAIGQGDYKTAMEELRARVVEDPADHASKILLARLIYQQNREGDATQHAADTTEALKLLEQVQAADPNQLSAISSRVSILQGEGKDQEAVALLDAEVEKRKDFSAYLLRAEYNAVTNRLQQAEEDYKKLTAFEEAAADGWARLGDFYRRQGRAEQALSAFEESLKRDPGRLGVRRAMISMMLSSKDSQVRDQGLKRLDESLKELPDDPGLLSLRGLVLLGQQTREARQEAVAVFERVVQFDPHDINAHLQLITNASEQGELEKASQLAFRATGANPENVGLQMVRAQLESDLNNPVSARELARKVLDAEPNNLSALCLLTRLALRMGDAGEAEKLSERAMKTGAAMEEVQLARAEILAARKQTKQAIRQLEEFRGEKEGGGGVRTLLALADLYRIEGDFAASDRCIAEAEKRAVGNNGVFIVKMRVLAEKKDFGALLGLLSDRIVREPSQTQVLMAGASILASAEGGEAWLEKAKPLFTRYTETNPKNIEGYLGQAVVAYAMHDLKLAEQAYRSVLSIDPYDRQAINNLAWILSEDLGRPKEALELADKGLGRYPTDPNLLNTRGTIYHRQGMWAQARKDLEKCIPLCGELPATKARTLILLSKIQAQQGEAAAAQASLKQAAELDRMRGGLKDTERAELQKLLGAQASQPGSPPGG